MNKIMIIAVIVGVIAILIGFLVNVGLSVYRANQMEKNTKFPPWPAVCPDYWHNLGDGKCKNTYKIGDCKSGSSDLIMDFKSNAIFDGTRGMYYKCNWAKQCNTPWEGIDSLC
jgi:ABC-type antimicrobial peptide transport system permease subunit